MSSPWILLGIGIGCYLVGSVPVGVLLSRTRYGIDVREMGSGNIGATNVTRNFGWAAGCLTLGFDFLKGLLPLLLVSYLWPSMPWTIEVAAISLVLGHCYSLYLRFRGGKGVATGLGCIVFMDPMLGLLCAVFYALFLWLSGISAVGSLMGVAVALIYVVAKPPAHAVQITVVSLCIIIAWRHRTNMVRMWRDMQRRE